MWSSESVRLEIGLFNEQTVVDQCAAQAFECRCLGVLGHVHRGCCVVALSIQVLNTYGEPLVLLLQALHLAHRALVAFERVRSPAAHKNYGHCLSSLGSSVAGDAPMVIGPVGVGSGDAPTVGLGTGLPSVVSGVGGCGSTTWSA